MRRFNLVFEDMNYKAYYKTKEIALKNNPNAIRIEEIDDTEEYMPYINKIKDNMEVKGTLLSKYGIKTELYSNETTTIFLHLDTNDNKYFDYLEYIIYTVKSVTPILRTMSNPREFCNKYLVTESMSYDVSFEDKKPKELKGVKSNSVVFIPKKCANQFFVLNDDLYIKSNDYFSPSYCKPEDIGTPLNYRLKKYGIKPKSNKFVYDDNWGDIVLRQKAWLKFTNIIKPINIYETNYIVDKMCKLIMDRHNFKNNLDWYWHSMFENIINKIKNGDYI